MATARVNPLVETTSEHDNRLSELERRVNRLESLAGTRVRTQEEDDNDVLSRQPNSYQEAVRYEAALERRTTRATGRTAPATALEAETD